MTSRRATIAWLAGTVVAVLLACEILARVLLSATHAAWMEVDIQTPAILHQKVLSLRAFEGERVALLGDSLAFGRTMREHGDANWRSHTIAAQLDAALETARRGPVGVMNFGMDGAVPADMAEVARLLAPARPNLVVFETGFRSFSADFAPEELRLSRPWLKRMRIDADGWLTLAPESSRRGDRIDAWFETWLLNLSTLYRARDLFQWLVLGGTPNAVMKSVRDRLDAWVKGGADDPKAQRRARLFTQYQTKQRFASVTLAEENPQRQSLIAMLDTLAATATPTIFFYAKENPSEIGKVIDGARYQALHAELSGLLTRGTWPNLRYSPPIDALGEARYLDFVHVDREGYAIYTREIMKHIPAGQRGAP